MRSWGNQDLEAALRRSALFANLSPEVIGCVAERMVLQQFSRGTVIFNVGEPGHEIFVVVEGLVHIVAPGANRDELINELGPGHWFGEMALMTGEPRSATAVAATDVVVLALARDDFQRLLNEAPSVVLVLSRSLSHRLRASMMAQSRPARPRLIGLLSPAVSRREADQASAFVATLADIAQRDVLVLDSIADSEPLRVQGRHPLARIRTLTPAELVACRATSSLCVARVPIGDRNASIVAAEADGICTVGDDGNAVKNWLTLQASPSLPEAATPVEGRRVPTVHLSETCEDSIMLRRMARRVLRCRVGLVLSAGGVKGLAHVGVVNCLERAGVEFDAVSGTSMGGIVGGLLAMGKSTAQIRAAFDHLARNFRRTLLDFGIPEISLLRGQKKRDLLREQVGEARIEDLPLIFWTVAADLATGREAVLGGGSLLAALDATSAIPTIFPPVEVDGRKLVDGWIVDPLPAHVLRREGIEILVGVDASGSAHASGFEYDEGRGLRRRLANPTIVRIGMRALELGARELTLSNLALVDTCVQPELSGISPTDVGRMAEVIERGEAAAEKALPALKKVLAGGQS